MSFFDAKARYPEGNWALPALEPIPTPATPPALWRLMGLHRQTGQWIVIAEFDQTRDKKGILHLAGTSTQPDPSQCWIRGDDFSMFKAEDTPPTTTFNYLRA